MPLTSPALWIWGAACLFACGPAASPRASEPVPTPPTSARVTLTPAPPISLGEENARPHEHPLSRWLTPLGITLGEDGARVEESPRATPEILDLTAASEALNSGHYGAVLEATSAKGPLEQSAEARLLRAEALAATGRGNEAEHELKALLTELRADGQRLEAAALLARLALARGALDAMPTIFSSVTNISATRGLANGGTGILASGQGSWSAAAASLWLSRGRWAEQTGNKAEAERAFMHLVEAYNSETIAPSNGQALARVAEAAMALRSPHDANDAFREAVRAAPADAEIKHRWAGLFVEKFDYENALTTVQEALGQNPNHAGLLVRLGEILMAQAGDFSVATALVERAEQIHPNFDAGQRLLAKIALRDMDLQSARTSLERALQANPLHPETQSLRTAERFLADDERGFERQVRETLKRMPSYARLFTDVALFAEWAHRYPDMVKLAERAISVDPQWAAGHATLGFNLLRLGDEKRALESLHRAWRLDRFNVRVFHLLNLYDEVIPTEYVSLEPRLLSGVRVRFRFHRDERRTFEPYVPSLVSRALHDMGERYAFKPKGPLSIELFATNEHFSIRTAGVPNLGVQGVCFGTVVTATSPSAGPTNWAQVLWHELSHVFHIQLSDNRVPRWFTEGLAEYESLIENPLWRREYDHHLEPWLKQNALPPIAQLNRAFTHARTPADMGMAYYASAKLVASWVERFGMDKMKALLEGWGEGIATEALLPQVLGQSLASLDAAFASMLQSSLEGQRRQLDLEAADADRNSTDCARRSLWALHGGEHRRARAEAQACLHKHGGDASGGTVSRRATETSSLALAHYVLGVVTADETPAESLAHFEASVRLRPAYDTWMRIGAAFFAQSRWREAGEALHEATALDPLRTGAYRGMLRVAEATQDAEAKVRALRGLAHLEQHDAALWLDYVGALSALEQHKAVAEEAANLIGVAPHDRRTHRLLAKAYGALGQADKSAQEAALVETIE